MMPDTATTAAAVFGATAVLLYLGQTIGDRAAQWTSTALHRTAPALAHHPAVPALVVTATAAAVLVPALAVLGLDVSARGVALALVVMGLGRCLVARAAVPAAALATPGGGPVLVPEPPDPDATRAWHLVWLVVAALIIAGFTA